MKKQNFFAFSLIFLLLVNFFGITVILFTTHQKNHSIMSEDLENQIPNLISTSDSENIFEYLANSKSNFAPLRIVTLVAQEDPNFDSDFAYLAAIPIGLYKENNITKVSPILFDDLSTASENFLIDWKNYCRIFDSWDGIKNIVYIGSVPTATKNQAEALLNPEKLYNPAFDPTNRHQVNVLGENIYDLTKNIATYFWYRSETAVIAVINDTFPDPQTTLLQYSNSLANIEEIPRVGEINGTYLENFWSNNNINLDTGGILVQINNTNDLLMELFGNFSQLPWMFDSNRISKNDWVFFPNVSAPADLSDWGIRITNLTTISNPIYYNLNFYNLTYQTYQIEINNSESSLEIALNWTDSGEDLKFWVLDPSGQLVGASSRDLIETGSSNKSSTILYPQVGKWTILVTRRTAGSPISYDLNINITNFSSYRRQCIESAANGAVIASTLNIPLLYVTNTSVPNETKQALLTLNVSKVIRVDPFQIMSQSVFDDLISCNVSLAASTNLTSRVQLYNYIYDRTQQPDIVLSSVNEGYFAPASLLAAFHGAPLLFTLNESYNIHAGALQNFATSNWVGFQNPGDSALLNHEIPIFTDMKKLSDDFYSWINSMNLDKAGNETVLVVSPITELNPYFDRAIYGKALVGRFIGLNSNDLAAFICRNILYPAISYSDLSFDYEPQELLTSCTGNSTITGTSLYAAQFSGTHVNCYLNDGVYHSYVNASNGKVIMAYYVNLSEYLIPYNNISKVEISIDGKINYANELIRLAGWGIWDWTLSSLTLINGSLFNATTDQNQKIVIDTSNKTKYISPSNSRIEIFVNVTTIGPSVNVSIDFLQFNVTYNQLKNVPSMLSSSITYWHDFTFQGVSYNYSSLIPLNFTQAGYQVSNATGYQEIYSQLAEGCEFWYYSGNSTLSQAQWNLLFTENNYWRAFGDNNDQGATPGNPDADGDHLVAPNETYAKWQTESEFNTFLPDLSSPFVLLQAGYLGFTAIPDYLIQHGATTVIANLKQNELGYSEHFAYNIINELLKYNTLGNAMFTAFN